MDKTNERGICLPRASSFSPTLRIIAWSDTSSIRKKLMYGSETHLTERSTDRCNTPCYRSVNHEISSSKSLRVRPQTVPYRSKSGTPGRPCSAPPKRMYQKKPIPSSGVPLSTLNLALPENVPHVKPANALQPKLQPKKKFPAWYNPDCPNRSPLATSPGV